MHAIIMGAGEGTRMWPISTMVNKHLLKLGGKPVIRIIVDKLFDSGWFDRDENDGLKTGGITIVCLKKDEKDYRWEFRDNSEVNFHTIEDNSATATEFYEALESSEDNDDILLHYGDTITDLDYGHFIAFFKQSKNIDAMIAVTQNIRHDYSKVDCGTNSDGAVSIVQRMEEKPLLDFPSWTGIGIFNRNYFIKKFQDVWIQNYTPILDFGFDILPAMVADGQHLHAYQYNGRWFDVGNLRSYQKLSLEYQNKDLNL